MVDALRLAVVLSVFSSCVTPASLLRSGDYRQALELAKPSELPEVQTQLKRRFAPRVTLEPVEGDELLALAGGTLARHVDDEWVLLRATVDGEKAELASLRVTQEGRTVPTLAVDARWLTLVTKEKFPDDRVVDRYGSPLCIVSPLLCIALFPVTLLTLERHEEMAAPSQDDLRKEAPKALLLSRQLAATNDGRRQRSYLLVRRPRSTTGLTMTLSTLVLPAPTQGLVFTATRPFTLGTAETVSFADPDASVGPRPAKEPGVECPEAIASCVAPLAESKASTLGLPAGFDGLPPKWQARLLHLDELHVTAGLSEFNLSTRGFGLPWEALDRLDADDSVGAGPDQPDSVGAGPDRLRSTGAAAEGARLFRERSALLRAALRQRVVDQLTALSHEPLPHEWSHGKRTDPQPPFTNGWTATVRKTDVGCGLLVSFNQRVHDADLPTLVLVFDDGSFELAHRERESGGERWFQTGLTFANCKAKVRKTPWLLVLEEFWATGFAEWEPPTKP